MMRGSGYARSEARMGRIRDAVWGRAAWYRNGQGVTQLPDRLPASVQFGQADQL